MNSQNYPVNAHSNQDVGNNDNTSQELKPPFMFMHVKPIPAKEAAKSAASPPYALSLISLAKQVEQLTQECRSAKEHVNRLAAKLASVMTQRRKDTKKQSKRKGSMLDRQGNKHN